MKIRLRKSGPSTFAVLPAALVKRLGLSPGARMTLQINSRGEIVLSPKYRYRLVDLIAQCDPTASKPEDLRLWESLKPVGGEAEAD
ncbi:MAG: AbrB/MazE/SpoVT family DNA-binding domain-containing protein [Gammaproteobacteria bacterium]|jgi:antitoxin ChpS